MSCCIKHYFCKWNSSTRYLPPREGGYWLLNVSGRDVSIGNVSHWLFIILFEVDQEYYCNWNSSTRYLPQGRKLLVANVSGMCQKKVSHRITQICYPFCSWGMCWHRSKSLMIQICYPCVVLTFYWYHMMRVVDIPKCENTCHLMDSHALLAISF